jgi:hypothetical protein
MQDQDRHLAPTSELAKGELSGPEQRILNACAWLHGLGQDAPRQVAVAFLAGYTFGGGAFNNPRGALRTKGLLEYVGSDRMRLTETGKTQATWPTEPLTAEALQARVLAILPGPEQRILRVILSAYPRAISKAVPPYAPEGGAFLNPCGRLRSLGLIDYPARWMLKASPVLFLEEQT